jgi:hypothetical protein
MLSKREIKILVFVVVLIATLYVSVTLAVGNTMYMRNVSAQIEQVEVVDKRIVSARNSDSLPRYYVTFKFSDGSLIEFAVGKGSRSDQSNAVYNFDAVDIGDTGTLTYKESARYGTRLERFEKDPALGGTIVEPYKQGDRNEHILVIIMCIVFVPISFFSCRMISDMSLVEKSPEQCAQVQLVGKRSRDSTGGECNTYHYYATFKFPDSSVKEFEIGVDFFKKGHHCHFGKIYASMCEGDTGKLTYKESEELINRINKEEYLHKGREFVSFEKDTQE